MEGLDDRVYGLDFFHAFKSVQAFHSVSNARKRAAKYISMIV
jgi:hypothetical protein